MTKTLPERYIQEEAMRFLEKYYYKYSHNNKIEVRLEATTQQNKRADGLLVWERAPDDIRVVSFEAKSATTVRNLLTRWNEEQLNTSSFFAAQFVCFVGFCILYSLYGLRLLFEPALLLVLLFSFPFIWKSMRPVLQKTFPAFFQTASVLEQVALYPGNESWIAISSDTFKKDRIERIKTLHQQCKRRKLGILEIQADGKKPIILLKPAFTPAPNKDFLSHYKKETDIRIRLASDTKGFSSWWNRSIAEKKYELRQFRWAVLFTLFLPFIYLFNFTATSFSQYTKADISTKEVTATPVKTSTPNINIPPTYESNTTLPLSKNAPSDCTMPFEGSKYILKDQIVPTLAAAQDRVDALLSAGCPSADYFWIPCSDAASSAYAWCVFAYTPQAQPHLMEEQLRQYQQTLGKAGLRFSEGDIWLVQGL